MPVLGNAAHFGPGHRCRGRVLVPPADDALELNPPRLLVSARKAQLAERDTVLGGPSTAINGCRHVPDRIPRVVVGVDDLDLVPPNAEWVDVEAEGSSVVMVAVDHHAEPVGVAQVHVSATQTADHRPRVVKADSDVQVLVVVEHADIRRLRGGCALIRFDLGERVRPRGGLPRRLVQPAIDADLLRSSPCSGNRQDGAGDPRGCRSLG